jgi:hypothetical protein
VRDGLGRAALVLSASDRELLDCVGRHPFLPSPSLATVLDTSAAALRRRRDRLVGQGLLRLLGKVRGAARDRQPVELTVAGLTVVAAQHGLTLGAAIRARGLAGGGPEHPVGARGLLLQHLDHTLEADDIFVRLIAVARRRVAGGWDDALVEWWSAAACCRPPIRPDGYGVYRHAGRLHGFFLEYDRGTMSARDYHQKLGAYYAYWASGRYERDFDGFPTILVVTSDKAAEDRIARAALVAAVGRGPALPLLLTYRWRIEDRRNPLGLLGPIWRDSASTVRRSWPGPDYSLKRPLAFRLGRSPRQLAWRQA